jgi:uncharacterized protein (DUF697 family)
MTMTVKNAKLDADKKDETIIEEHIEHVVDEDNEEYLSAKERLVVLKSKDRARKALSAENIISKNMLIAMGVGIIPIPVVDFVAVTGVQIRMLRQLSELYGVPFSRETTKSVITALVGGALPAFTAFPVARWAMRYIPVVGWTLGAGAMSILSGASTYAVGKVFEKHFQSGGTILDLDLEKAKADFDDLLHVGKKKAVKTKKEVDITEHTEAVA